MNKWTYYSKLYPIVVLALILIIGILFYNGIIDGKDVGTASMALIDTLLGATLAFQLNEDKEKQVVKEKQIQAINSALLIMMRQHNALVLLKRVFDEYPNDIEAAFNMPALQPPNYNDLVQNISALEFLIDSKDPNILFKIIIEQERFYQTIESWKIRNNFYVNEFQHIVSDKGLNKQSFTLNEAEKVLGDRVLSTAINSVRMSREHILKSCESLPIVARELREIAKELYPNQKFLIYEITE